MRHRPCCGNRRSVTAPERLSNTSRSAHYLQGQGRMHLINRLIHSKREWGVEMALQEEPRWMAEGACKEHPEVDFFPPEGGSGCRAIEICSTCAVRAECLSQALSQHEFGIWGGTTERARARMRRASRRVIAKTPKQIRAGSPRISRARLQRDSAGGSEKVAAAS